MIIQMKYILSIIFFFSLTIEAQVVNKTDSNQLPKEDTLVIDSGKKDSLKIFKPTINDYLYQKQFAEKRFLIR
uniref:Uncharacterized protein n=1 Tax=Chryseobacterium endophyticum TaxID=1854762 RepID=A0AAU6WR22_9FLAO